MNIAFLGLGSMGLPIARNLISKGHEVHCIQDQISHVDEFTSKEFHLHETLSEAVKNCETFILSPCYSDQFKTICLEAMSILPPQILFLNLATIDPHLSQEIASIAKEKGILFLDCPLIGTPLEAERGTLTILVGGDMHMTSRAIPLLKEIGPNIHYIGDHKQAQQAKLTNQILVAGILEGLKEAIDFAHQNQLDDETLYMALRQGTAGSKILDIIWPKLINEKESLQFHTQPFLSTLKLAQHHADEMGISLPVCSLALDTTTTDETSISQ